MPHVVAAVVAEVPRKTRPIACILRDRPSAAISSAAACCACRCPRLPNSKPKVLNGIRIQVDATGASAAYGFHQRAPSDARRRRASEKNARKIYRALLDRQWHEPKLRPRHIHGCTHQEQMHIHINGGQNAANHITSLPPSWHAGSSHMTKSVRNLKQALGRREADNRSMSQGSRARSSSAHRAL